MSPTARTLNRSAFFAALMLSICLTTGIMAAMAAMKDDRPWWAHLFFSLQSVTMFMAGLWWTGVLVRRVLALWLTDIAESKP